MIKRIARITPHQTGKVLALAYLWLGVLCAACFALFLLVTGGGGLGATLGISIGILVCFPVIGYVSAGLFAWVYNWAAQRVGGIEFLLEDSAAD